MLLHFCICIKLILISEMHNIHTLVYYFKLTHRSMITIHSVNGRSQVITGFEFNCLAAMKGAHHVLLLILPTPSGK